MAIVLVLGIEISAFYLLRDRLGPESIMAHGGSGENTVAPIFVSVPAVLANLGDSHQLSLSLEIMTREAATASLLNEQIPLIRNEVVAIFDQQPLSFVTTVEGKERIRDEALERVRRVIHEEGGDGPSVEGIYFSSLIVE